MSCGFPNRAAMKNINKASCKNAIKRKELRARLKDDTVICFRFAINPNRHPISKTIVAIWKNIFKSEFVAHVLIELIKVFILSKSHYSM